MWHGGHHADGRVLELEFVQCRLQLEFFELFELFQLVQLELVLQLIVVFQLQQQFEFQLELELKRQLQLQLQLGIVELKRQQLELNDRHFHSQQPLGRCRHGGEQSFQPRSTLPPSLRECGCRDSGAPQDPSDPPRHRPGYVASGSGQPGVGTGTAVFARALQDRAIVRTSYAEYPAALGKPASRHDDPMVIYTHAGVVRADYYDSEGHVIRTWPAQAAWGKPCS